jgi:hypothetical protein
MLHANSISAKEVDVCLLSAQGEHLERTRHGAWRRPEDPRQPYRRAPPRSSLRGESSRWPAPAPSTTGAGRKAGTSRSQTRRNLKGPSAAPLQDPEDRPRSPRG